MKKQQLFETFDGEAIVSFNDGSTLNESEYSSLIDGQYIIGIVEGQFFQPDGMSRNGRWYSRRLWENVLNSADVKNRLLNHTMFGEIGHSDGPVTDMTLRKGEASHFIADLWIDEKGRGMGRAYILDTPTGRLLKKYLGATCKLKVSTRGEGVYLDGQLHDGRPVIDPDTYELQTVDFVLNPGFLETSANLTVQKESVDEAHVTNTQTVSEENIALAKKEGETSMPMDMDTYVAELKEELKALKAENKSLAEELKSKDKELLLKNYEESAEVKKISEAFAPFKKIGASAKTINETLQRSQKAQKEAEEKAAKLTEELDAYKAQCGSLEQLKEATTLSENALNQIAEYKKVGTPEQVLELFDRANKLFPELKELRAITESYKNLGEVEDLKNLKERCAKLIPSLESLKAYEELGTVESIKESISEKDAVKAQLAEAESLGETVKNLIPQLEELKKLREYANRAHSVIEQYIATVGSIKKAKALTEAKKETIKKVNVREAMEVAKTFNCTVESAAKLIQKYGKDKATSLLESKLKEVKPEKTVKLAESVELVEEAAQMDKIEKVNSVPAEKTAADFLKPGRIANSFNKAALGRKMDIKPLDKQDGEKVEGLNQAKQLLQQYKDMIAADVEKAPKTEEPKTAEEAEKEAKELLDK